MTAPGRLITLAAAACRAAQASPGWLDGDRVFISLASGTDSTWYARGYPQAGQVLARDLAQSLDAVMFLGGIPLGDVAWAAEHDGGRAVPPDRITRVCAAAEDAIGHGTADSDRAIIAVSAPPRGQVGGRSGMALFGYASARDETELRQQVAWDLAGAVHAILGWPRPRPVPGTWPEPFLDCSPGPALADLAAHPGCRLPLHRPGCPDWRP